MESARWQGQLSPGVLLQPRGLSQSIVGLIPYSSFLTILVMNLAFNG